MSWWMPVKKACEEGTASATFVRDALLAKEAKHTGNNEEAMYLAMGTISAGGNNNTRILLNTLVMAALCHPDATTKARKEADAVCSEIAERLPGIGDILKMPSLYLRFG